MSSETERGPRRSPLFLLKRTVREFGEDGATDRTSWRPLTPIEPVIVFAATSGVAANTNAYEREVSASFAACR